jgi:hypothetical protein
MTYRIHSIGMRVKSTKRTIFFRFSQVGYADDIFVSWNLVDRSKRGDFFHVLDSGALVFVWVEDGT